MDAGPFAPLADVCKVIRFLMAKNRTPLEKAAGQLVLVIQKEWDTELGTEQAGESEATMYLAHEILQACKSGALAGLLNGREAAEFLGQRWVDIHPRVHAALQGLEAELAHLTK